MNNSIQTKHCPRCQTDKSLNEYYARRREEASSYCKVCVNEHALTRFRAAKERAVAFLGGECARCGFNACYGALHFHHLDPNKKDPTFSGLLHRSWEKIQTELEKCELLCANCHAVEHCSLERGCSHSVR